MKPAKLAMLGLTILSILPAFAIAQVKDANVPDFAREEVLRRGDRVHRINGFQDGIEQQVSDALKPPADDSDKWFITMLTTDGCVPCEQLKAAWKTSPHLQAWAKPQDPQHGWAFWNCYNINDKNQKFRWEKIKIDSFPTILIQPCRNGAYGDPSTVVAQITGFDGNDKKLSERMAAAVQKYLVSLQQRKSATVVSERTAPKIAPCPPTPSGGYQLDALSEVETARTCGTVVEGPIERQAQGGYGQAPFTIPGTNPTTPPVQIPPVLVPPGTDPPPAPVTPDGISALVALVSLVLKGFSSGGMTNFLMIGFIGVQLWRTYRKATHQPLLLDDATIAKLEDMLTSIVVPKKP